MAAWRESGTATQTVLIALGSNLGDRLRHLETAVAELARLEHTAVEAASWVYETPPWGRADQPAFLNAVVRLNSTLAARTLLSRCLDIERAAGRERTDDPAQRNGPRQLDLDILFVGQTVQYDRDCIVPHPRLHRRAFALLPLCDVAPDFVHPILNRRVDELLALLPEFEVAACVRLPGVELR